MGKRGRKPSGDKKKVYFGEEEENAVREYLLSNDMAYRNAIFNKTLLPAFNKLVECIIRKYNFYIPGETYEETFSETLMHLIMKADKFKPSKNKKAYSYYGTICKNFLNGRIQNGAKKCTRFESFDENIGQFEDNLKYSSYSEKNREIATNTVEMLAEKIGKMVESPEEYALKESEIKMGNALKTLLDNWDFVLTTDGSNKLNKNAILLFLRETTGFDTKGVRDSMKKFKNEFLSIKQFLLS